MNPERYTVKSQEALERAQRLARGPRQPGARARAPVGRAAREREGTIASVLSKLGVSRDALQAQAREALDRLPRLSGAASMVLGAGLRAVLDRAEDAAAQLKDEYVSLEHFLMALASDANPGASRALLQRAGVADEALLKALATVRGAQRVTDAAPEDKYQALTRYGRDLTRRRGRQARSRDRPRRRDSSRDPGAGPAHQEQPRCSSATRAWARPRSSRAWRSASCRATCPRASSPSASWRSIWGADRRQQVQG